MGVVIYGRRAYGRVHGHEGEYADTQFAHIDFIPLFPLGSFWVTQDLGGGQRLGFPIKLHGRSVAATYLRIWGPPIALGLLALPGLVGKLAALALALLVAWSWTWRSLRGGAARRRSDFNRVAFGSRCEPAWMRREMRDEHASGLRTTLAKRSDARPPDDVARFGARDPEEAILAYGLLRIGGVEHRAANADADRIVASAFETRQAEGGPYREAGASEVGAFGDAVAKLAQAHAQAARVAHAPYARIGRRRWFQRPRVQLAGLVLATPVVLGMVAAVASELGTPRRVTAAQLDSIHPPLGPVAVSCDRIEDDNWEILENDSVVERVTFCWIGKHALPVVSAASDAMPAAAGAVIDGKLRLIPDHPSQRMAAWIDPLRADHQLDAHSFGVYLARDSRDVWISTTIMLVFSAAFATGWIFWFRGWRRRRAARAAT